MGISRAQFIRSAIRHEVRRVRIAAMANAMAEMSKDPAYMVEFEEWDNLPSEGLPEDEPGGWWEFPTGESKP